MSVRGLGIHTYEEYLTFAENAKPEIQAKILNAFGSFEIYAEHKSNRDVIRALRLIGLIDEVLLEVETPTATITVNKGWDLPRKSTILTEANMIL